MFALICLVVLFKIYNPLVFERHYLSKPNPNHSDITLAEIAGKRAIFLGAAVRNMDQLNDKNYTELFNSLTPENHLKLGAVRFNLEKGPYYFEEADKMVDAALERGIRVRGHALVFGKLSDVFKSPDLDAWLAEYPQEQRKALLLNLMTNHIEEVMAHYQGRIKEWDVVNEVLNLFADGALEENVYYRYIGEDYIRIALEIARKTDPAVKLYVNEQFRNYNNDRSEAFYHLVKKLVDQGVPLDGIGIQGHHLFELPEPASLGRFMARLGKLGLDIEITELEARLRMFKDSPDPYTAQGEYYSEIVAQCLQIEACKGVTFWGYSDDISWMDDLPYLFPKPNEAYLLDALGNRKPVVQSIKKMLSEHNRSH